MWWYDSWSLWESSQKPQITSTSSNGTTRFGISSTSAITSQVAAQNWREAIKEKMSKEMCCQLHLPTSLAQVPATTSFKGWMILRSVFKRTTQCARSFPQAVGSASRGERVFTTALAHVAPHAFGNLIIVPTLYCHRHWSLAVGCSHDLNSAGLRSERLR